MEKIKCPNCHKESVKNGFQNNKQRYECKSCSKRFQLKYNPIYFKEAKTDK